LGAKGLFAANRLVLLAGIPIFLVLAVVAWLAIDFAASEREEQASVVHTYQVMDQIRQILIDVQGAETSQRGYIITRDPVHLTTYRGAVMRARADIIRFRDLTRDNPVQQERAGQLAVLVGARLDLLEHNLALAPAGATVSPELRVAMENGRDAMDRLHGQIALGVSEEERLLALRQKSRRQAEANEINTAFAAAVVALLVLLIAAMILVRNNARLAQSEASQARQRGILQATLDNIRDGVAVFDTRGRLVAFNRTFFQFLDFPQELAVPGAALENFRDIDRHRDSAVFDDLPTATGEPEEGYQRVVLGGRELDVYRNAVPGGGFLVAVMDVSDRVRSEAAVRQTQKMEAIGHLTGGVAHDFNNLLQIISANLDLAAADMAGNPRVAGRLQNALGAVERGSRLTGQLLAFARRQALVPRSLNLTRLLPGMTDLLRRTLGERIEVETVVAGGLWNTSVDANQLENAVINLAINSRDAMPDGGKLTIEVANAFLDDAYKVEHPDVTPGQYVMLAVSDTGSGMTEGVMARVFEPFFTTKPEGQGTGLGLSQVYGFVKQSGGHIKVYSEVGEGTTIKLYLPRTRRAEEETRSARPEAIVGGSETILVVEDDEGVRAAVIDMLGELGYHVLKAINAEDALTVLRSGVKIDLLFTDVVMPGPIPTRELARRAQEMQPGISVLFTSGYTQNAIVHNGKLDDDVFLLSKPYRRDDLARKLRAMLSRHGQDVSAAAAQIESSANPQPVSGHKALIVEDVVLIRMTTADMMAELGFETREAANGDEALKALENDPGIGVMLTDLGLPGMTGGELAATARRLRPNLRIVVASGYSSESASDGLPADAVFLQKPFDLPQLRRALGIA
jgi:signal transduction histidine kinase/CheY-like chemotaxis protein